VGRAGVELHVVVHPDPRSGRRRGTRAPDPGEWPVVVPLLFAVATAAVWGTADFCGGKASQRAPALTVSVLSKLAGLPVLALALTFTPGRPTTAGLAWGGLAGLFGMAGVILLYRGLATGAMTIVAPVTAVTSALIPFTIGVIVDGTPGVGPTVGAGCAVAAIGLVSAGHGGTHGRARPAIVGLALAAGTGFGLFMTFLSRVGDGAGLWPLTTAQLAALALGGLLLVRSPGAAFRAPPGWTVAAGVLDLTANVTYLYATQGGQLSIVAPVASLYPANTVLLALAVDRERIRPVQILGLALTAAALVLVAS
jgi:drug/metabolite transporter (DMT)-like permease